MLCTLLSQSDMIEQSSFAYDVFLSFSSLDETIAREIWEQLTNSELLVFWSDEILKKKVGVSWFDKVEKSLVQSQHMVVLITKNSLNSEWVMREYKAFLHTCQKGDLRRLIPLLGHNIEVYDMPVFMQEFQSFKLNDKQAVASIGALLGKTSLRLKQIRENSHEEDIIPVKPITSSQGTADSIHAPLDLTGDWVGEWKRDAGNLHKGKMSIKQEGVKLSAKLIVTFNKRSEDSIVNESLSGVINNYRVALVGESIEYVKRGSSIMYILDHFEFQLDSLGVHLYGEFYCEKGRGWADFKKIEAGI